MVPCSLAVVWAGGKASGYEASGTRWRRGGAISRHNNKSILVYWAEKKETSIHMGRIVFCSVFFLSYEPLRARLGHDPATQVPRT